MTEGLILDLLRGADDGALPPGPRTQSAEEVEQAHRRRLVAGMAEAAAEKGYGQTTIADVVARAKVSRRTFYEHFADKEACFLAAYETTSGLLMDVVERAAEAVGGSWTQRIDASVRAYLHVIATDPELTRLFLVDVLGAGPVVLRARRAVHTRFAGLVNALVEAHAEDAGAGAVPWDPRLATAIIGGIDELVRGAIEDGGGTPGIAELERTTTAFVSAVIAPAAGEAPAGAPRQG